AASREGNTEHGKIVRANDGGKGAARIVFLAETDQREIESHGVAEDGVLLADIAISRVRKPTKLFRILLILRKELHHFVRLVVSRRGKEKRVDQAEYGGIHANPEREHGCRRNRKCSRFEQLPERKFEILNHALWLSAIMGSARVAR